MPRKALALVIGLLGFLLYIGLVLWIGDWVQGLHWAVQFLFYLLAGFVWVFPALWLIRWAIRPRP
jgi:hypothetical protein